MKYKETYWIILKPFIKKYLKQHFDSATVKTIFKNAKEDYKSFLAKADDIGSGNPMASNLYFSLLFLSFLTANRDLMTEDVLIDMMESVIQDPFVIRLNQSDFNQEKDMDRFKQRMKRNAAWAEKHRDLYPETWDFNFDDRHQDGCFYYFTKCPIAKFFQDNNLQDLTHLFCKLDYLTIKARKGRLIRNHTIANGDSICDFWIVGDEVSNPK